VRLLRAGDDAFALVEAGGFDFGDFVLQVLLEFSVHWVSFFGALCPAVKVQIELKASLRG
jgi:hypothetical protein